MNAHQNRFFRMVWRSACQIRNTRFLGVEVGSAHTWVHLSYMAAQCPLSTHERQAENPVASTFHVHAKASANT